MARRRTLTIELARHADRNALAGDLSASGLEVRAGRRPEHLAVAGSTREELVKLLESWLPPDHATLVPVPVSREVLVLRPPSA
jgi:hypothetical protein